MPTALGDAQRFLHLHPWCTNETDNPVAILRELAAEAEALADSYRNLAVDHALLERDAGSPERLTNALSQIADLVAFIKRLNADEKISDIECQAACAIARRTPDHLAASDPGDLAVARVG